MGRSAAVWDPKAGLEVSKDWNGIDQILLKVPRGASALVSLQGGHVTSWRNERGEELLFTSNKAIFKPPKEKIGGIPICFPQFGSCGLPEHHGFARGRIWVIDDQLESLHHNNYYDGKVSVDLLFKPTEGDAKFWPNRFELRLRVSLSADGSLSLVSSIRNTNGKPFSFSFAYHPHLSVSDISEVRIEGLETLDYLDNLAERKTFVEQGDAITFESEVDRVYVNSPEIIAILDHEKKRTFVLRKDGLSDVVVWNPWEKKSKSIAELGDDEYKQMLCVHPAAVEKPITLKPGEEWTGRMHLTVVPSSFGEDLDLLHPSSTSF